MSDTPQMTAPSYIRCELCECEGDPRGVDCGELTDGGTIWGKCSNDCDCHYSDPYDHAPAQPTNESAPEIPEDLMRMAIEIISTEAACIEWGATAARSRELVLEKLMFLRQSEKAFADARVAERQEQVERYDLMLAQTLAENQALTTALAAANARVQALEWRPITPESLPKFGDEVLGFGEKWIAVRVVFPDGEDYKNQKSRRIAGYTHYRPIGPPSQKGPQDA